MNTKAFSLCWEGSNLILGTGKENQICILRTPATIKLFLGWGLVGSGGAGRVGVVVGRGQGGRVGRSVGGGGVGWGGMGRGGCGGVVGGGGVGVGGVIRLSF